MKNPKLTIDDPHEQDAMTLRDYFAAKAMQEFIRDLDRTDYNTDNKVAQWAYGVADAMLKEREE